MKSPRYNFFFPFSQLGTTQKIAIALLPILLLILLRPFYPQFLLKAPIVLFYPFVLFSTWLCGGLAGFITLITATLTIFIYIRPDLSSEMAADPAVAGRLAMFYVSTCLFQLLVATLEISLKKAEKSIKERDDFLSVVSHELRTPITSIKLQLEVLKDQLTEKNMPLTFVNAIERQMYRQSKLVNSMLDLAMIESGDIGLRTEKWNLDEIITRAVKNAVEILNLGDVKLNIQPAIVRCDRKRIEQSVYNLVHNALKYGDKGSVEVSLQTDSDYAIIKISNNGKAISGQNEIFKKMKRPEKSEQVQGIGLGLYLANHLIELHGGKINLLSNDELTTFTIKLPLELNA